MPSPPGPDTFLASTWAPRISQWRWAGGPYGGGAGQGGNCQQGGCRKLSMKGAAVPALEVFPDSQQGWPWPQGAIGKGQETPLSQLVLLSLQHTH